MDQDHYWANWSNACPYTVDSVYVMVEFLDRSRTLLGDGVWALHFVLPGTHRVTRFTAPRDMPDFDSVRVQKITSSSEEALLKLPRVPDRPAVVKVERSAQATAEPGADSPSAGQHHRLGRKLLESGNYRAAIAEFTEAIQMRPDFSLAYNARGFALYMARDYRSALVDLDAAIRLDPNYVNAYQNRSHARKAMGDLRGSTADIQAIRDLLGNSKRSAR